MIRGSMRWREAGSTGRRPTYQPFAGALALAPVESPMTSGRRQLKLEELSDIELVDRVIRPGAFEGFYGRHGRLIYHCIRKRADARDVDDIFQGYFERLTANEYRALRLWQGGTSLSIYLATIARNLVIDFYRRRGRLEVPSGGLFELEGLSPAVEEGISVKVQLTELRKIGIRAWADLEPRDRSLICEKLHRDKSHEDIAARLRLTAGAFRTALSRAQARFLAGVRQLAPEFFPDEL
jgi:RNA polymerase sigma factor (sigma-70 family)